MALKNKWAIFIVHRPLKINMLFFSELRVSTDKAKHKYDRIIIIGDININSCDESIQGKGFVFDFRTMQYFLS